MPIEWAEVLEADDHHENELATLGDGFNAPPTPYRYRPSTLPSSRPANNTTEPIEDSTATNSKMGYYQDHSRGHGSTCDNGGFFSLIGPDAIAAPTHARNSQ